MINKLPAWCIINKFPAFYDVESATAIEQTARVYGKMNELVDSYNGFAETLTNTINGFIGETEGEYETFKIAIRQEFQDFINTVDLKVIGIQNEIAAFENVDDKVIETLQNDIELLKVQFTTLTEGMQESFENFKNEINEGIEQFKTSTNEDMTDFKAMTNQSIIELQNNVNDKISQFETDIYNFIQFYKTQTGGAIFLDEGNKFIAGCTLTATAPTGTPVYIFNENAIDKNVFYGCTVETESGSGSVDYWGSISVINRTAAGNLYLGTFFNNTPAIEFTYTHETGYSEEFGVEFYGTVLLLSTYDGEVDVNITDKLVVGDKYILFGIVESEDTGRDTDGNVTNMKHTVKEVYLLNKSKGTVETVKADGSVSTENIGAQSIILFGSTAQEMMENENTATISYYVSDFVPKSYVDEKIAELEESLNSGEKVKLYVGNYEGDRRIFRAENETDTNLLTPAEFETLFKNVSNIEMYETTSVCTQAPGTVFPFAYNIEQKNVIVNNTVYYVRD